MIIQLTEKYSPIPLSESAKEKLRLTAALLREESAKYNLTALKTDEEIALLHFVDSLTLFTAIDFNNKSVIDIGCGAGFPALVIAAANASARVTALDSTSKKIDFVKKCAEYSSIENIEALASRAEEAANTKIRQAYDIAVSRGVARLCVLAELCLPFVNIGGTFIAMKGDKGREEAREAEKAITALGGETAEIKDISIPVFDRSHTLIIIKKTRATDSKYPRMYSKIVSKPIV